MAVAVKDRFTTEGGYHQGLVKMKIRNQKSMRRIFVQTDAGNVLEVALDRNDNAHSVKKKMQVALNMPTEESTLTYGDTILKNDLSIVGNYSPVRLTRTLFPRSISTPCFSTVADEQEKKNQSKEIEIIGGVKRDLRTEQLIHHAVDAVETGIDLVATKGGLGGSYYLRNPEGENVAIVKPTDEEPFAPNNPNGFVGKFLGQPGLKRSVRTGETGIREVAAYLLDHDNFAGVPPTVLVKITHSIFHMNNLVPTSKSTKNGQAQAVGKNKMASFQEYVIHDFDAGDHGPSNFSVAAVHRIGILDIRILNTDRHAGNILVKKSRNEKGQYMQVSESDHLIPIDHGLCLPETLEDPYFEWLHWPQASVPFSESELAYIRKLDPVGDADLLRKELPMFRDSALRILTLCTLFLKRAADAGLCLAEIGEMMSRELNGVGEKLSLLEVICLNAMIQCGMVDIERKGSLGIDPGGKETLVGALLKSCARSKQLNGRILDVGSSLSMQNTISLSVTSSKNTLGQNNTEEHTFSMSNSSDAVLALLASAETTKSFAVRDATQSGDEKELTKQVSPTRVFFINDLKEVPAGKYFTFSHWKKETWASYLESFEALLPEAFALKMNMRSGYDKRVDKSFNV